MAAPAQTAAAAVTKVVIKTEPSDEEEHGREEKDEAQLQEPVVPLLAPVCGLQPLHWSQDHRLCVGTNTGLSVMELRGEPPSPAGRSEDPLSSSPQLNIHRSSLPATNDHHIQVGPPKTLEQAYQKFSMFQDPVTQQAFLANTAMNPKLQRLKGVKYVSWSPLGCDSHGNCLLACITLDHKLVVYQSHRHLEWDTKVDLSQKYGARLKQRGYAKKDNVPPQVGILNFEELRRRFEMQTPVGMEWSSVYTTKQVLPNNICEESKVVMLAVLMENGDLVLWKFALPFCGEDDVGFYDIIESEVDRPSALAWWEYESENRRMSGLILGSQAGPVKIMPVSLTGIKGYFTLRHPIVLWKDADQIMVKNINCVPVTHPTHNTNSSLIIASRGCYIFWCLLTVSNAGLKINNSHVAGLFSLPVVSLTVCQQPVAVYTCSSDGWVKRLTPTFTEKGLFFKQEDLKRPQSLTARRIHGLAVSHNGAYVAIASTQGMDNNGFCPFERTYHVHFLALKSAKSAGKILLCPPVQSLHNMADLLSIVRCEILRSKRIPTDLQQELDRRIQEEDLTYLWKLKLFLARTLYLALQGPSDAPKWKPRQEMSTTLIPDGDEMETEGERHRGINTHILLEKAEDPEEQMSEVAALIDSLETRLMKENVKRLLGAVYLNSQIIQKSGVPTCGLVQYMSSQSHDRDAEVLIGHLKNKLCKQSYQELCSLCEEVLPFDDCRRATCANGHVWPRCGLSYQACQALTFRRCLLLDTVSVLPKPEDPPWIQKMLQAPCTLCDSPLL
ncbi:unnamed protein product [Knipowitschia caucasica]